MLIKNKDKLTILIDRLWLVFPVEIESYSIHFDVDKDELVAMVALINPSFDSRPSVIRSIIAASNALKRHDWTVKAKCKDPSASRVLDKFNLAVNTSRFRMYSTGFWVRRDVVRRGSLWWV